jgi:hypothetical protein
MPGLVINGAAVHVQGLNTQNYLDVPALRLKAGEDMRIRRSAWIRNVILHTTKGIPGGKDKRAQKILSGYGPNVDAAERVTRYWSKDGRNAGAHIVVDHDGLVTCCADLQRDATYHAGNCNESSIGVEIYQGSDAELYEGQLEAVVVLCDFLTSYFKIQRQFHWPYKNKPISRFEDRNAVDFVGVFGHRDCSSNRGLGDPGDAVFEFLYQAGYERFDCSKDEDKATWKVRQAALVGKGTLGITPDGVPGPRTAEALIKEGYPDGIWVRRPSVL